MTLETNDLPVLCWGPGITVGPEQRLGGEMFASKRLTVWLMVAGVMALAACGGDSAADATSPGGTVGEDQPSATTSAPATSAVADSGLDESDSTPLMALPTGRLVFDSRRGDGIDLYLLEAGSTEAMALTGEEGGRLGQFTPDGSSVLFHTDRAGGPDSPTGLRRYDLYRLDLATGEQTHLLGSRTFNSGPTLSPDGSTLAFGSDASGSMHIYLAGADASSPQQVTEENSGNSGPDWSPDGSQIIYSTQPDGNWDIWIMNADGSDRRPLIEGPDDELAGVWSPDGTQIAFHSNREGTRDVFLYDVTGGDITQLTSGPKDDGYPTWSPDGDYIAFDSDRDGREQDIYLLTLADGSIGRLTDDPSRDTFPDWGE